MILLVTNKQDFAADRVVVELDRRAAAFVRLNTEDFPTQYRCLVRCCDDKVTARLDLGSGRHVVAETLTAVWYRRPEPSTISPRITDPVARRFARLESEAALRGFLMLSAAARWINHPEANRSAEHKLVQLAAATAEGFRVPQTLVSNDPDEATRFYASLGGAVIVKTVGTAFVHPDHRTRVYTSRVLPQHLDFIGDVVHAPVVLQERIEKRLELRVTVVGQDVLGAAIDSQASPTTRDDWRRDVFQAPHAVHHLPDDVAERCLRLVRRFRLFFATLDFILTPDGQYVFLELNPNGEWDWIAATTGLPIAARLADLLSSDTSA